MLQQNCSPLCPYAISHFVTGSEDLVILMLVSATVFTNSTSLRVMLSPKTYKGLVLLGRPPSQTELVMQIVASCSVCIWIGCKISLLYHHNKLTPTLIKVAGAGHYNKNLFIPCTVRARI